MIAGIAQALGAERINIADFDLQHLSSERGGTLAILVAGEGEAARAAALLEQQGYGVVVAPVSRTKREDRACGAITGTSPSRATSRSRTAPSCSPPSRRARRASRLRALRGHGGDDQGGPRPRRAGLRGRRRDPARLRRRPAAAAAADEADRLPQRRDAHAPAAWAPRRAGGPVRADGRRLLARPMDRIAEPLRRMGVQVETTDGRAPLAPSRAAPSADHLRAAGRERAGEVGRAARRPLCRRGRDDGRGAAADA